jgi:uncharacterized phage protein (TIGR01671 family)
MTREIKFRAWGKYDKKMVVVKANDFQSIDGRLFVHDAELMQFTGLKDRNGKEIYEGDIVARTLGSELWSNEEVFWSNELASWRACEVGKGRVHRMDLHAESESGGYQYEVIGNIYENPELLK